MEHTLDEKREAVQEFSRRLETLVIFRDILQDQAIRDLQTALRFLGRERTERALSPLAAFEARIFDQGGDWSRYLARLVSESENVCIRHAHALTPRLTSALEGELELLQELSEIQL